MKKTSIIAFLVIAFCGILIFACNKLTPDPGNIKAPYPQKLEEPVTVRAKISSSSAATMVIENVPDEVKVTTSTNIATEYDHYGIYAPSGVTVTDGEFFLDQNSIAWWLVPFDDTKQPLLVIAGGSGAPLARVMCECVNLSSLGGNCCELGNLYLKICTTCSGSMCGDCDMMICKTRPTTDSPWIEEGKVSYAFVNSNKLRFNGVLYTAPQ